ncbi:CsgG/HfaB family protein [Polaribacter sp. IC073]|uniref:CsgG/HfaB family protein n=1 Tax=Polaribacter sp. IC073 TaxID=2508540 RepID=UPI0011BE7F74|nr:CsgG/HfaB family protein [Polaribacter sp. IC073]TXD45981.1 outer membrane beta-barrel protein [Polaribacter sp. IC073]
MRKLPLSIGCLFAVFLFVGCGAYFNQPLNRTNARIGENTSSRSSVKDFLPKDKMVVGVYKFRDQTGQYKPIENGSTFSTAVTQGGTSILLKSLEDSKWFKPIERENIGNLLNERQIIRNTRQEHSNNNTSVKLPPLLFAGIIIEGGVVSYDSNIITGGSGLRYFGVGGSNKYRQDRITVYLRVVSTTNGQILKNVYASKTILSQGISANFYRFVALRRLLEVETGVTKNEPAQLAIKEAIDKAVELLIVEGIVDGLWQPEGGDEVVQIVKENYQKEKKEASETKLFDRKQELNRSKNAINVTALASKINGDYSNSALGLGFDIKYKYTLDNPKFAISASSGLFELKNTGIFKESFINSSLNLEFILLPYDTFTPYLYAGIGSVSKTNLSESYFKFQYGLGLEYLISNNWGVTINGEHNMLNTDNLDNLVRGQQNDQIWNIKAGFSFYF